LPGTPHRHLVTIEGSASDRVLVTGLYLVVIPGLWLIRRFRNLVVKGQLLGLLFLRLPFRLLAASPPARGVAAQTGAESHPRKRLGTVAMAGRGCKRRTTSRNQAHSAQTRSPACAGVQARPTRRQPGPPWPGIVNSLASFASPPPARTSACSRWRPRGTEPLPRPCHVACSAGSCCSSPTSCHRPPSRSSAPQLELQERREFERLQLWREVALGGPLQRVQELERGWHLPCSPRRGERSTAPRYDTGAQRLAPPTASRACRVAACGGLSLHLVQARLRETLGRSVEVTPDDIAVSVCVRWGLAETADTDGARGVRLCSRSAWGKRCCRPTERGRLRAISR
jgi:hypothetical protein